MKNIKKFTLYLLEQAIFNTQKLFTTDPYLFLSEDDFKCQIYAQIFPILDKDKIRMHTEVSFYDKNDKLSYRPDIAFYPKKEINNNSDKFYWDGRGTIAIVEIKFVKNATQKYDNDIKKDLEKIKEIQQLNPDLQAYIVIFSFPYIDFDWLEKICKERGIKFFRICYKDSR